MSNVPTDTETLEFLVAVRDEINLLLDRWTALSVGEQQIVLGRVNQGEYFTVTLDAVYEMTHPTCSMDP